MCAAVIVIGGAFLTRFADAIAELTKLGLSLVSGSVPWAGATSLHELTVDTSAIRMKMPALADGALLGSKPDEQRIAAQENRGHSPQDCWQWPGGGPDLPSGCGVCGHRADRSSRLMRWPGICSKSQVWRTCWAHRPCGGHRADEAP